MALAAGGEIHRPGDKLLEAEPGQQLGERQILAERHEMHLVDRVDDLAAVVDGHDRIVVAAAHSPRRHASARTAPAISIWPGSSMSPMRRQRVRPSVNRNGTDVSGHRISCGFGVPGSGGCAGQLHRGRENAVADAGVPFLATGRWPAGRCGQRACVPAGSPGRAEPDIAEADMRARQARTAATAPSAQIAGCAASSAGMAKTKTASAFMPIMPVTDTLCISKRHRHRRVADRRSRESR